MSPNKQNRRVIGSSFPNNWSKGARHIENWTGLQTLRDVDMELYTGLQRLTITRSNLHMIQSRVFSKNPYLRYM
ncbi:NT-3 growth factor receptor [Collichthys lucidus]|uniref:NT-3 growth factor receptor n=1 Tax=Collichthys lucidus TaxID=240159 RepID=A0A4U5UIJ7_COLLU|nr:NT-3 growth factor receptor [Collichthys lucidus]